MCIGTQMISNGHLRQRQPSLRGPVGPLSRNLGHARHASHVAGLLGADTSACFAMSVKDAIC